MSAPLTSSSRAAGRVTLLVAVLVWVGWLIGMASGDRWSLFGEAWFMSVTMVVGSFIAGATSEGGGAVAFPVMTLLFEIPPPVARDFSLMIQTVGMIAAAITIFAARIPVERRALVWSTVGGALGVIVGLEFVAPQLQPKYAKMTFLSVWLAFAFALFWINRYRDREVRHEIEHFGARHVVLLLGAGAIGGTITAITGSGLDILTFSLLVLRFRITESIATPTSVVLMGVNAAVAFAWKGGLAPLVGASQAGMAPEAWTYWWVCVPIVVVGAPLGARFIRNRSRLFVAGILYVSIAIQFVAGLAIIPQSAPLLLYSTAVFAAGLLLFSRMAAGGVRRLAWLNEVETRGASERD